jgi:hypothetical protein
MCRALSRLLVESAALAGRKETTDNHLIFRNFYGLYPGGPCFDGRSTVGGLHHDGTADTADTWEFKSAGANFQEHLSFTLGNGFDGQYSIDSCRVSDDICLGASYPVHMTCNSSACNVKALLPLDIANNYYAVVHITGTEEPPSRARSYTLHLLQ